MNTFSVPPSFCKALLNSQMPNEEVLDPALRKVMGIGESGHPISAATSGHTVEGHGQARRAPEPSREGCVDHVAKGRGQPR